MDRRRFLTAGATSNDPAALASGGYWQRQQPHPAVHDIRFQDLLLTELSRSTGTKLA